MKQKYFNYPSDIIKKVLVTILQVILTKFIIVKPIGIFLKKKSIKAGGTMTTLLMLLTV